MKNFYNKGLQLKKARSFVDTFRYEHIKDPERTLIEKDAANTEWNKNLGILTTLVDEEKLSEDETVDIIKKLIRLLGTCVVNSGKKVQAVRGIKKELEEDVAGRNPIKTMFDFQVRFGYYRLEEIKALQKTDSMGRLGDNNNKRRNDYDHRNNPKRGRGGRQRILFQRLKVMLCV